MTEEIKNDVQEQEVKQEQEQPNQEAHVVDTPPKAFEIPTEAQDYVGEGKKYRNPEDALKSVPHAQQHISTLEAELAEVKEELVKRRTAEELLDELKSGTSPVENTTHEGEVSQDKIEQLVNSTLAQREKAASAKNNAGSVAKHFTEKYGNKAEEVYNSIAKETGLSVQQLNNLAATSPNAVIKLAGNAPDAPVNTSPQGDVNTQALSQAAPTPEYNSHVKQGATTKDLLAAWKNAGEYVKNKS